MTQGRVLVFAGSTREHSLNKKLARAAAQLARMQGLEPTFADLRDFPMPLYDGDLEREAGLPEGARAFKALLLSHPGWLVACPEYNSAITAVLKNAIDWASRPQPGEAPAAAFRGKLVGLLAASPGNLGGIRGLYTVRQVLNGLGCLLLPTQFSLPQAGSAFGEDGALADAARAQALADLVREFGGLLARLGH